LRFGYEYRDNGLLQGGGQDQGFVLLLVGTSHEQPDDADCESMQKRALPHVPCHSLPFLSFVMIRQQDTPPIGLNHYLTAP
jgi:hypothetical protein